MELLMLGVFGSAELVGKFAITFFAVQAVTVMIETVTTAVLPGVGSLLGKGEMEKVRQVRMEGNLYSWWLGLSLSVAVIVVNQSFVAVWVGEEAFAGRLESFLIVVLALQLVVLKNDSLLINLALEQKRKVQVTALSIGAVFLLSALLVPEYGVVGVCLAGISGRAMLMVFYPRIINRFLQQPARPAVEIRRWVVSATFLVSAVFVAEHVTVQGWLTLFTTGAVTFLVAFALYYLAGMSAAQRQLAKACNGEGDLDLLFDRSQYPAVTAILASNGFKRLESKLDRQFPGIEDYVGFDVKSGRCVHLQAHYCLVTGQALIKNYHLAVERTLLQNLVVHPGTGVKIPDPQAEAIIHLVRTCIKIGGSKIFRPALYRRMMADAAEELAKLESAAGGTGFEMLAQLFPS
ncbi:Polysaccharide biosynthesis protein, partial [Durusdinium trenchii]